MATKKVYIDVILPTGVAAFPHIYEPDAKVPTGATWKPDGKNKITVVFDTDADLAPIRKKIVAALSEAFPQANAEEFKLPIKEVPADSNKENLRGKFLVLAATQPEKWKAALVNSKFPALVDSKGRRLDSRVQIKAGDRVRVRATANLYSKTEKVKIKEGGKLVEVEETVYGANLWLNGVMLIEKLSGGGGGWGDAVEDGYENLADDEASAGRYDDASDTGSTDY